MLAASPARASRRAGLGRRPSRPSLSWRLLWGAMMRRRSSSSNSSVEACGRALGLVARHILGAGVVLRSQLDHEFLGFPARQDGVDAARRPGQLVLQHGVGARAGLTHAVLDVSQRAHGELQAAGQIGAVAVAQCDAPTHDVVAEPFQGMTVHRSIMTHQGGNVESPCPFRSICCTKQRKLFLGDSGQVCAGPG